MKTKQTVPPRPKAVATTSAAATADQLAFAFPPSPSSSSPPAAPPPVVVPHDHRPTAAGERRAVSAAHARAAGFRWPLAITGHLWADVETVPGTYRHGENVPRRWHDVLLLVAAAAAQLLRREGSHDGRAETSIKVILRTTTAPARSHEHLKTLCLILERDNGGRESFTLGYGDELAYRSK